MARGELVSGGEDVSRNAKIEHVPVWGESGLRWVSVPRCPTCGKAVFLHPNERACRSKQHGTSAHQEDADV